MRYKEDNIHLKAALCDREGNTAESKALFLFISSSVIPWFTNVQQSFVWPLLYPYVFPSPSPPD